MHILKVLVVSCHFPVGINLDLYSDVALDFGCMLKLHDTSEAYLFRP